MGTCGGEDGLAQCQPVIDGFRSGGICRVSLQMFMGMLLSILEWYWKATGSLWEYIHDTLKAVVGTFLLY